MMATVRNNYVNNIIYTIIIIWNSVIKNFRVILLIISFTKTNNLNSDNHQDFLVVTRILNSLLKLNF